MLDQDTKSQWTIFLLSLGFLCLLWAYTAVIGVAILAGLLVSKVRPQLIPGMPANRFRKQPLLQRPLVYQVSNTELKVIGDNFKQRCKWTNVADWSETDGWIVLSPNGMQELYLKKASLEQAEVYDAVVELASKCGARSDILTTKH